MNFWIYLILVEVVPLGLWIMGGICESKASKFPETKYGYKSKISLKNKNTWEYANRLVAQMNGTMGTFLFIVNAIFLLTFGLESMMIIFIINIIGIVFLLIMIEKLLKKKFDKEGKTKS